MARVRLQMISLCSLLIISEQVSSSTPPPTAAAARASRCISWEQLRRRAHRYPVEPETTGGPRGTRTCEQAAREMRGEPQERSLSPWTYRLDRDEDRVPAVISVAECLCRGCIINQRHNLSFNSQRVFAPLLVLRRSPCRADPRKYALKRELMRVPVACTCVVPKVTE